jgi:hypothetical protein
MDAVLDDAGFQTALLAAVLLSVVVLVMARGDRDLRGAPAIAVLATLVGYSVASHLEVLLVVGLAALAAGAWATRRGPFLLRSAAAAPGAVLVALSLPDPVPTWAGCLAVAAIVPLDPVIERFDTRAPRLAAPFLLVAAVGIYVCVPETNAARALLGGFGVAALLAGFPRLGPLPGAASAAGGLLVWTAAAEGFPRPGSVVGAVACVGTVVFAPALVAARGATRWLIGGAVVALVAFCARVAGFEESAWVAVGLTALGYFSAAVLVYATSR